MLPPILHQEEHTVTAAGGRSPVVTFAGLAPGSPRNITTAIEWRAGPGGAAATQALAPRYMVARKWISWHRI